MTEHSLSQARFLAKPLLAQDPFLASISSPL